MGRRNNILFAEDGEEVLKAVDFPTNSRLIGSFQDGVEYSVPWGSPDPSPTAFTIELYLKHGGQTGNLYFWGMPLNINGSIVRWYVMQRTSTLRFGYTRQGGFGYRREYSFPNDGNAYHFMFTNNPNQAGSARERCYRDNVTMTSTGSAYVGSGILDPSVDPYYFSLNNQNGATSGIGAELCYLAVYNGLWLNTAAQALPYFDLKTDLDARRASKPVNTIQKPDLFWCANDIDDLSVSWTESNSNIALDTTENIDNTDIILFP